MNIYKCDLCGTIVEELKFGAMHPDCCGQPMTLLVPGTSDGSVEKHLPVMEIDGKIVRVQIGENAHPMLDNHYIEWIAVETTRGMQKKYLKPCEEPKAVFLVDIDEDIIDVYAYCNLHGLWRTSAPCIDDQ